MRNSKLKEVCIYRPMEGFSSSVGIFYPSIGENRVEEQSVLLWQKQSAAGGSREV